jgi:hypothetical protein
MLGDIEIVGDLADGSERIRRLVQMPAPFVLAPVERLTQSASLVGLALAVAGAVTVDPLL